MKESRFTEQQIIAVLKEAEAGYRLQRFAVNMILAMHPFTFGAKKLVACQRRILNVCVILRKKTVV